MSDPTAEEIADSWIDKWSSPLPSAGDRLWGLDWPLPSKHPRLCLDSIICVLARIPSDPANKHFQALAAGPLENLLVKHGPAFLQEITTLAGQDPAFRLLLNGVWPGRVSAEVADALAKYMGDRW